MKVGFDLAIAELSQNLIGGGLPGGQNGQRRPLVNISCEASGNNALAAKVATHLVDNVHADAIPAGARVIVHDDLIATGGTASAVAELVQRRGGEVVAFAFLIELTALGGRNELTAPTHSLIRFDS